MHGLRRVELAPVRIEGGSLIRRLACWWRGSRVWVVAFPKRMEVCDHCGAIKKKNAPDFSEASKR